MIQEFDEEDEEVEIIAEIYDGVTEHRGLGRSGKEIYIVGKRCEVCNHDRMIQIIRVNPEHPTRTEYKCQSPTCPEFHNGDVIPGRR